MALKPGFALLKRAKRRSISSIANFPTCKRSAPVRTTRTLRVHQFGRGKRFVVRNGLRFWTCFLLVITLLGTADGKAETFQKYVFAGAAGDGSGSDWNNAYTAVPTVLQRDTVYYFAGGSYGCRIIDTAVSGNKQVIFRKATAKDHGTDVGWSDRMADSPAKFDCLQIFTSYVTIDGSTGYGTAGYGFEFFLQEPNYHLISVPAGFPDQTDITIKHCELHFGSRYSEKQAHALYFPAGTRNLYIGFNYIHDIPGSAFLSRFCENVFFEYNTVSRNRSTPAWHAEGWSDGGSSNVTVRYNTWEDIEGTGILVNLNAGSATTAAGWLIYGNVCRKAANRADTATGLSPVSTCSGATTGRSITIRYSTSSAD